jgi:hypothetical protein
MIRTRVIMHLRSSLLPYCRSSLKVLYVKIKKGQGSILSGIFLSGTSRTDTRIRVWYFKYYHKSMSNGNRPAQFDHRKSVSPMV